MHSASLSRKVLVTGASGLLGQVLMNFLADKAEAIGLSKSGLAGTISCDLTNQVALESFFKKHTFDLVIHAAAYSDVDGCELNPKLAFESNAFSTEHLARLCQSKKIPLIYVSTDYVFSGDKKSAYTETDPVFPINIYGMSKLGGEYAANVASFSAIVRTSWLFGGPNPKNFVNAITARLKTQTLVEVLDDQVNAPTHVKDLSQALWKIGEYLMLEQKTNPKGEAHHLFHVCNKGEATRYQMTLKIKEWLGLDNVKVGILKQMNQDDRPAVRPTPYSTMSPAFFEKFFNFKLRSWEESLREYVLEAYSPNEQGSRCKS